MYLLLDELENSLSTCKWSRPRVLDNAESTIRYISVELNKTLVKIWRVLMTSGRGADIVTYGTCQQRCDIMLGDKSGQVSWDHLKQRKVCLAMQEFHDVGLLWLAWSLVSNILLAICGKLVFIDRENVVKVSIDHIPSGKILNTVQYSKQQRRVSYNSVFYSQS